MTFLELTKFWFAATLIGAQVAGALAKGGKESELWYLKIWQIDHRNVDVIVGHDRTCIATRALRYLQSCNPDRFTVVSDESHMYYVAKPGEANVFVDGNGKCPFDRLSFVCNERLEGFACQHFRTTYTAGVADLWYTKDIELDRRLADSLCRTASLPPGYGIPIRCVAHSKNGKQTLMIFNVLAVRRARSFDKELTVPANYKPAKERFYLTVAPEDMDSLFRSSKPTYRP